MSETSAIGSMAGLEAGQVLLPGFISQRADGLYVDLLAVDSRALIERFVERVFQAGARFTGLEYDLFLKLLFDWQPADIDRQIDEFRHKGTEPKLLFARGIVAFPPDRRSLYKNVKVLYGGQSAEYIFEPLYIERVVEDPQAPDGTGQQTVRERVYGDFDEFVAALWEKGIRYGIDVKTVREAMTRDKAERLSIAKFNPFKAGKDATIAEQTDLLHRDDAPRMLPDGRMDLYHFRNRFPQVSAGTRLFKKIPRVDGVSGWDVQGHELAPPAVKDFAIDTLAGAGTQVINDGSGEYVVAAHDGFIDIDVKSGKIAVMDKIVSREGVSLRTTGNLSLAGDEFEEHGEVQEKRVVEGHNMTFFASVFGNVVSNGGRVVVKLGISGGGVRNRGGQTIVEGNASRTLFEAPEGQVTVANAESCTIIAAKVVIERAVLCDIVADEVEIGNAEGCAIAASRLLLKTATARRDNATVVTLVMPDLDTFDRQIEAIAEARTAAEAKIEQQTSTLNELAGLPDMKTYFAIQPRLKAKTLTMTPAQQTQWQALLTRIAPSLRQFAALNADIQAARHGIEEGEAEREKALQARREAMQSVACAIGNVAGDTVVRALEYSFEATPLAQLAPKELHVRLRKPDVGGASPLFAGDSGAFNWQPPQEPEA